MPRHVDCRVFQLKLQQHSTLHTKAVNGDADYDDSSMNAVTSMHLEKGATRQYSRENKSVSTQDIHSPIALFSAYSRTHDVVVANAGILGCIPRMIT